MQYTEEQLKTISGVKRFFHGCQIGPDGRPVMNMNARQRDQIIEVYKLIFQKIISTGCTSQCREAVKKTYDYIQKNPGWPYEE